MFTGIIEQTGRVSSIETNGSNRSFWIESALTPELSVDQSISHNGVCLTVEAVKEKTYRVTAIDETLRKTNLGNWEPGTVINLERCMQMGGRIDGHIVQGHVDGTGVCKKITDKNGSWEFTFQFPGNFASLVIEKGSISLNGISLTVFDVGADQFTVAIIPYTFLHTNMQYLKAGDMVNIEFDMIGKYVSRLQQLKQ